MFEVVNHPHLGVYVVGGTLCFREAAAPLAAYLTLARSSGVQELSLWNDRIEQIGYTNPSFDFDPKSTFEIRNGCRIMYDMCEKDTYESVKVSLILTDSNLW